MQSIRLSQILKVSLFQTLKAFLVFLILLENLNWFEPLQFIFHAFPIAFLQDEFLIQADKNLNGEGFEFDVCYSFNKSGLWSKEVTGKWLTKTLGKAKSPKFICYGSIQPLPNVIMSLPTITTCKRVFFKS